MNTILTGGRQQFTAWRLESGNFPTSRKLSALLNNEIAVLLFVATTSKAGIIDYSGHEIQAIQDNYDGHLIGSEHGDFNAVSTNEHSDGHDGNSQYSFSYAVHDPHTGDVKHHSEERLGHQVKGSYSLKEADGSTRVVEYSADKHNGFQAQVHKLPGDNGHSGAGHY